MKVAARPANTGTHPLKRAHSKAEERAVERLRRICLSPPGLQEALIDEDPVQFFKPPYVGQKGWVGVRISGKPDWKAVESVVKDAHDFIASSQTRLG